MRKQSQESRCTISHGIETARIFIRLQEEVVGNKETDRWAKQRITGAGDDEATIIRHMKCQASPDPMIPRHRRPASFDLLR